jgi:EAL and modified HD-GYP domain-containing signal transduction protein
MEELFACRQPIFDRQLNVIGYELLYRNFETDRARFLDGDVATSQVILNTYAEIGPEVILGDHKAFINLTRNFLVGKYSFPVQPRRLVLEVPENIVTDPDLVASLRALASQGYEIALDDVTRPQSVQSLLDLANIVKLDLPAISRKFLAQYVDFLREHTRGRDLKLLAEKVETQEEFELCKELGFDYFQGYFLCKPKIVRRRQLPPTRLVVLRLLDRLHDSEIDFGELEELVAQDALLGYKLLRLTNSTFFGVPYEVKSIRQGMALLGLDQLRAWLMLFFLARMDDKPRELSILAIIRAKMCELLANSAHEPHLHAYFLVGLLSSLDALMDQPLAVLLENVRLSDEVVKALLEHTGRLGEALECVLAYERADWQSVRFAGLSTSLIRYLYMEALGWVSSVRSMIGI